MLVFQHAYSTEADRLTYTRAKYRLFFSEPADVFRHSARVYGAFEFGDFLSIPKVFF